jgi:hypothetical protein
MVQLNYTKTLKDLGIAYLGKHSQSMKMRLSSENGTITYCLYLAPWNLSGYQVCPGGLHCHKFCLNGSGHNKSDILARGIKESKINKSRIKRTRLFYENKDVFMRLLIHEIQKTQKYAEKHNMGFSVRLNGTSDLSPEAFVYEGKNILQWFPNIQFYDYTKVFNRVTLLEKYNNYHLTFSYDGHNWEHCKQFLAMGGNVAVVFANQEMIPMRFAGYPVCDGNLWDMRYLDPKQHVVALHYHTTAANYDKNGNYIEPNDDFVIGDDNELVEWYAD